MPPRYLPARPLPAHAFIPGQSPHEHRPAEAPPPAQPLDPARWRDSSEYLWGIDLYNHGYPWEAHEAWEGLWQVAARHSPERAFLQGLIQCAAAVVKARSHAWTGATRLGASGIDLLRRVMDVTGATFMGVDIDRFTAAFDAYITNDAHDAWPIIELDLGEQGS